MKWKFAEQLNWMELGESRIWILCFLKEYVAAATLKPPSLRPFRCFDTSSDLICVYVLLFSVPLEHVRPFRAPRRVYIPTTFYSTDRGTPNAARSAERTNGTENNSTYTQTQARAILTKRRALDRSLVPRVGLGTRLRAVPEISTNAGVRRPASV